MITDTAASSDKVEIDAPVELVWEILVDFENYGNWNTFCPSIKSQLKLGTPVEMMVDMGAGLTPVTEFMTRIEPNVAIAWAMENRPEDPVHAERTQYLNKTSEISCTYVSIDEFGGPQLEAMMETSATAVETGFNKVAYDLKAYAEKVFKEQ
jgi:uncharacterized protein YndB with AHSA1/START domain